MISRTRLDLVASWTLDCVDEGQRRRVERWLRDDVDLAEDADRLLEVAGLLGAAVEPVAPSAALRGRILAAALHRP